MIKSAGPILTGLSKLTGRQPGVFPASWTGPGLGTVGKAALGAGAGYLLAKPISWLFPRIDEDRAGTAFALMGGMAGAGLGALDMSVTRKAYKPEGATSYFPYQQKTAGDKGWVGVPIRGDLSNRVLSMARNVEPDDLHEKGRETDPHVTVIYGLAEKGPDRVRTLFGSHGPLRLQLGRTSLFRHPDKDVLKLDVASRDLRRARRLLKKNLPVSESYRSYQPHVTLAYLKPGTGQKYVNDSRVHGQQYTADRVQFNNGDTRNVDIPLSVTRDKTVKKADDASSYVSPPIFNPVYASMPGQTEINVATAANTILADPHMGPAQKSVAFSVLASAAQGDGRVTVGDLARGAMSVGLGYGGGVLAGKVLGAVFGLPEQTQRRLGQVGAVAGLLRAVGVG